MGDWTVTTHDRIAVCTFTRPPRNFMSFQAMTELESVLNDLAGDTDVHVVVLTGGVEDYFVAHADLDDLTRIGRGEKVEGDPGSWSRALALLESMPQPTVAAIDGQAHGGGCEIALACTLRLVSPKAHLAQPEVVVGIIPGAGGTQRLPRLIGQGRAAELILSGRRVEAEEAVQIGLANTILPGGNFVEEVLEWLAPMAGNTRASLAAAKKAVIEGLRTNFADGLALEGRLFIELQMGEEALGLQDETLKAYRGGADPI